ncbi:MAG: DUF4270 domain-containing protein [Flavobacterium sp.]|nr:DUF4270 domain-containing protein [Pedobacter sp.]
MRLFNPGLLTLLISLFILTGCQNPDGIGLDVDPDYAIKGNLIDTITVISHTVKEDSVKTNSLAKYPFGYLNDPVFGITDAKVSMSLTLPSNGLTFGTSPVLDSAVLVLKYADEYTGDPSSQLMVEVYQLRDRLTENSNFFSNTEHLIGPELVGSKLVKVNIKDSVLVTELVKGKVDISKKIAPHIRIPINPAFIVENFLKAPATSLVTDISFNEFFKGLQIKTNKLFSTGPGGLTLLDLAATNSRLEIYYKNTVGAVVDTTLTSFNINTGGSAATIIHNYAGTAVETQLANPLLKYDVNFVQPLSGVKTSVQFPYIQNLKALGNIIINKAELIAQIETGSNVFSPSPKLIIYRTDIADQRQPLPDVLLGLADNSLGGFYDSTKKQYRFTLTAYIQDLLSGKLTQYNTFITAVDSKANNASVLPPSASTVSRTILGSGNTTLPIKMKLNIIYTKVN